MQKFSDFAEDDAHLDGAKKPFDEVIGKKIFVYAAKEMESQYDSDQCVMLQFSFEEGGERFVTFTGSGVIARQVAKYKDNMPFETVIEQRKSKKHYFYTFT